MNRYRIVYSSLAAAGAVVSEVIDAPSAAEAIATMGAKHDGFTLVSIRIDTRDPAPTPTTGQLVVIDALASALLHCNTVLLALLNNPVFKSSLSPARLASLEAVTQDAQAALDFAAKLVQR